VYNRLILPKKLENIWFRRKMSFLLSCQGVSKAFGAQSLFQNVSFGLSVGDRLGVIGPNGSGKSTLLKIICGLEEADEGAIVQKKFVRTGYLAQETTFDETASLVNILYEQLEDEDIQDAEKYSRVHTVLSKAEFDDHDALAGTLSGGWRKRLAICRTLVTHPDILVMDEPTNHLDIEGILWLEKLLAMSMHDGPKAVLLVSHDRQFLENCSNRVVELSAVYPEGALQVEGNYSAFITQREEFLKHQEEQQTRLSNKVRRETEWLRRGPKARSTKAKYRIDAAHKLIAELGDVKARNNALSSVNISFDATGRKTKKLVEATGLQKTYGDVHLFSDLDILLSPGFRLGLLGRNGCGKSSLMQLLETAIEKGGLRGENGEVKVADNVVVAYFDQQREKLDFSETLKTALAPDGDSIVYRGRVVHVVSWAKRFLFTPDQLETPVGTLSGGEQARILLARLMRQQADVLLLDEPTNDLDIDSLDMLEESLMEFPGAMVLVSHDRFMLDRVCDLVLGFDGNGEVNYYGDYAQWLSRLENRKKNDVQGGAKKEVVRQKSKPTKLSYMDQRDYDTIEERIETLEEEQQMLQKKIEAPEVASNPDELQKYWQQLSDVEAQVEILYQRWDELEAKQAELSK
jgi:ATP-binding cassette subfamily F protein uup